MEAATDRNGGFIVQSRWEADASGAMVTDPASNHFSSPSNNAIAIGVQFRCRRRGITLLGIGDSLVQGGSATFSNDGYSSVGFRVAADISATGIPCGFANFGNASQTAQVYQPPGIVAISAWTPNAILYEAFSPNNSYASLGVSRYQLQQQAGLLEEVISTARANLAVPFIITGIPSSAAVIPDAATDALRVAFNTKIIAKRYTGTYVCDWDDILSNDASPARMEASVSSDGIHYNENQFDALANQVLKQVKKAFLIA